MGVLVCEMLFYAGVGVLGAAGGIGLILLIVHLISGRRLKKRLVEEYGKKRH